MFKLQMRTMDLFLLLGLILTGAPRAADGQESVTVKVREGHEAILPCNVSINMESKIFVWKNKDKKEVFFYDNNGRTGNKSGVQLKDFNDRAFHFKEELKNGNISIRITNTKKKDSGAYSCCFSFQEECCHVQLEVDVCPKPDFTEIGLALLLCEVSGVSSQLQLKIKDSSGTALSDQPKKESKGGGTFDMVLQTNVTKSGVYSCVATQEDICHQISSTTYVYVPGPTEESTKDSTTSKGTVALGVICGLLVVVVVVLAVALIYVLRKLSGRGPI